MRSGFGIFLIAAVLFFGGYFYYVAQAVCPIPLEYSVGELDPEFGLSFDEAKSAIATAGSVWEDATEQHLFTYDEDAPFTVNFIYDDRQAERDAEENFKDKLDQGKEVTESINDRYQQLIHEYDGLQVMYSTQVTRYEKNISVYNTEVESLNTQGGVDAEQYAALQERKVALDQQREDLDVLSMRLKNMVTEINKIGDQGNGLIETYNRGVEEYNETFGDKREFTQGTYSTDGRIDIFSFKNHDELRLVLAHELGHALSLDHVSNEQSIMYFLIGNQPVDFSPTTEDMTEFNRVCSQWSMWDTIKASLQKI